VDVKRRQALEHALECMEAAYGHLIEKNRQLGRISNAKRLEVELKRAERILICSFRFMESHDA